MEIKQKWINENGIFFPIPGSTTIYTSPGDGVFQVVEHKTMTSERIGITKIADEFTFDFKIYDLGIEDTIEKIIKTWKSDLYVNDKKNLGIIFNGIKGTGKTIASKILCNRLHLPVIIINQESANLIDFIQSLEFECIVLIDEAEKTFKNEQEELLKMIDGVYNASRKLYILTTNELRLDDNLLGRPGRIRYIKEFGNLTINAINDYIQDNLIDKNKRSQILEVVDSLEISTIDILKAIVDEVNVHGEISEENILNIPIAQCRFQIAYFDDIDVNKRDDIKNFIRSRLRKNETIAEWLSGSTKEDKGTYKDNVDYIDDEFNGSCYTRNIVSTCHTLKEGSKIKDGELKEDLDKDGFAIIKYIDDIINEEEEKLCCVIKCYNTPSLYRGKLK